MKFYRYQKSVYSYKDETTYKIRLQTFFLIKETKKGYWIGSRNLNEQNSDLEQPKNDYDSDFKKWIPKESMKRFAYPTKEEALFNFKKRTEKAIKILEHQLQESKTFVKMCEENVYQKTDKKFMGLTI